MARIGVLKSLHRNEIGQFNPMLQNIIGEIES